MAGRRPGWSDERVDRTIGGLLRLGVVLAASVVAAGGVAYLVQRGSAPSDHRQFHGEPADLRGPAGVVSDALAFESRGVIQLGLLLLIATPVARVAFAVYAFDRQHDRAFVGVSLVVLAVLLYSLLAGG
jgi:uncharacterized membrane protein